MKEWICTAIGVVGSFIASLFGGWDAALATLVIFMAIDYVTGLIVAGVFHNSGKTENGALESRAGWKGLCRKGVSLLVVLVACRLDLITGTNFIRDARNYLYRGERRTYGYRHSPGYYCCNRSTQEEVRY